MKEPFVITIDCSKILPNNGNAIYSMYIDQNKMTIVYELIEWLQWIFSLEDCFYLTYKNSVVHELEDIEVLSTLKNFELKPCGECHCVHKKFYRTLLSKLDFFTTWNNIKVPKYFLEKVSNVKRKLGLENLSEMQDQSICQKDFPGRDREVTSKCSKKDYISKETLACSNCNNIEFTQTKTNTAEKINENSKLYHQEPLNMENSGLIKGSKIDFVENSMGETNFNGKIEDENVKNHKSNQIEQTLNKTLSPVSEKSGIEKLNIIDAELKNQNLKQTVQPNEKINKLRSTRPFFVSEILANIRNEYEKKNDYLVSEKSTSLSPIQNCPLMQSCDVSLKESINGNSFIDETKNSGSRKRKRTRRGGKKLKEKLLKSEDKTILPLHEKTNGDWDLKKPKEIKPYHIWFESEGEDEAQFENRTNVFETSPINNNIHKENKGVTNTCKSNLEELMSMINEKKQALSAQTPQSPNQMVQNLKLESSLTKEDYIKGEEYVNDKVYRQSNTLKDVSEECESTIFSPETSALRQLKEKFPSPVVIERFY